MISQLLENDQVMKSCKNNVYNYKYRDDVYWELIRLYSPVAAMHERL